MGEALGQSGYVDVLHSQFAVITCERQLDTAGSFKLSGEALPQKIFAIGFAFQCLITKVSSLTMRFPYLGPQHFRNLQCRTCRT